MVCCLKYSVFRFFRMNCGEKRTGVFVHFMACGSPLKVRKLPLLLEGEEMDFIISVPTWQSWLRLLFQLESNA